jgi:hypothetical protein
MSSDPFTLNTVESASQVIHSKLTNKGAKVPSFETIRTEVETLYLHFPGMPEVDDLVQSWFRIENNWDNVRGL